MNDVLLTRNDIMEIDQPWGDATEAIEAALHFWSWKGLQNIGEQRATSVEYQTICALVQSYLPDYLKHEKVVKSIVDGSHNLTHPHFGKQYETVLNQAIFMLSMDPSLTTETLELSELGLWDKAEIMTFAKLATSHQEQAS